MSIADTLTYEIFEGSRRGIKLRLYALSTCAFCEKALEFLKEHDFAHEYLMIDTLDPEVKRSLKKEMKETFGPIPVFPVLIINDADCLTGFTEETWRQRLGVLD